MGLKRRFQNLLRGASNRSVSQTRCQRQCCQHQQQQQPHDSADHLEQHHPQLGRRGPTAACTTMSHHQQQQKLRDRQLSRSCERRRGNQYASFSTTTSTASTGSSSSSSSSASYQPNLWRPAVQQLKNFTRLESADASCYVAELSSSFSASSRLSTASSGAASTTSSLGGGAPVYEEISPEPLYDCVATSAGDPEDSDEFISRYWLYSSLPRQHRRRGRQGRIPDAQSQQQVGSATGGQCLPLGLTHVDWRGVKCTSF